MTATAPLLTSVKSGGLYPEFSSKTFLIKSFLPFALETIMGNARTRKIGYFVVINLAFTAVELFVGWMSNSLGLLGDGVHMLFDSSVLAVSLLVVVISKYHATLKFSYGFTRAETLTALVNSLLLFYAAGSIVVEALHRFVYPEEMEADNTIVVSILGLLVNIIGIFAFDSHSMMPGHDHHHHDHHHHDEKDHHHHHHHHHHHDGDHSDIFHGKFFKVKYRVNN